jgi:phosphotransferase system  glucose/maltose/N-acetylglucosamine-specific IIC component
MGGALLGVSKGDTVMHYLKKHPSNIFNGLVIFVGVPVAILGASNLLLLIAGIVISVLSAFALIFSIRESRAAEREAQQQRREQKTQIQSVWNCSEFGGEEKRKMLH